MDFPRRLRPNQIEEILRRMPETRGYLRKCRDSRHTGNMDVLRLRLQDVILRPSCVENFTDALRIQYELAGVPTGEQIGLLVSSAITRPLSQGTMKAFSATSKNKTNAMSESLRVINLPKDLIEKSMKICYVAFWDKYLGFKDFLEIRRQLIEVRFKDLLVTAEIFSPTDYPPTPSMVLYGKLQGVHLPQRLPAWFLRIQLDSQKMFNDGFTMGYVARELAKRGPGYVLAGSLREGLIHVYPDQEAVEADVAKTFGHQALDKHAGQLQFLQKLKYTLDSRFASTISWSGSGITPLSSFSGSGLMEQLAPRFPGNVPSYLIYVQTNAPSAIVTGLFAEEEQVLVHEFNGMILLLPRDPNLVTNMNITELSLHLLTLDLDDILLGGIPTISDISVKRNLVTTGYAGERREGDKFRVYLDWNSIERHGFGVERLMRVYERMGYAVVREGRELLLSIATVDLSNLSGDDRSHRLLASRFPRKGPSFVTSEAVNGLKEDSALYREIGFLTAETEGGIFSDILNMTFVDPYHSWSNSPYEMEQTLGISAARKAVLMDMILTLGTAIDTCHYTVIADYIVSLGYIVPLTALGTLLYPNSTLTKMGIHDSSKRMILSAISSKKDLAVGATSDLTASVISGNAPFIGSATTVLREDPAKKLQLMEENITRRIAELESMKDMLSKRDDRTLKLETLLADTLAQNVALGKKFAEAYRANRCEADAEYIALTNLTDRLKGKVARLTGKLNRSVTVGVGNLVKPNKKKLNVTTEMRREIGKDLDTLNVSGTEIVRTSSMTVARTAPSWYDLYGERTFQDSKGGFAPPPLLAKLFGSTVNIQVTTGWRDIKRPFQAPPPRRKVQPRPAEALAKTVNQLSLHQPDEQESWGDA